MEKLLKKLEDVIFKFPGLCRAKESTVNFFKALFQDISGNLKYKNGGTPRII